MIFETSKMEDCWGVIIHLSNNWKNLTSACKLFYSFRTPEELEKRKDKLSTEVYLNPDHDWDWGKLSKKNLSIEVLSKCIHKPWNLRYLSRNPNLTLDLVLIKRSKPWNTWDLKELKKIGLTHKIIFENAHLSWDWKGLSKDKDLEYKVILDHIDKPWDWLELYYNKNIPLDLILEKHYLPDLPLAQPISSY